jgi:hypothetical protein
MIDPLVFVARRNDLIQVKMSRRVVELTIAEARELVALLETAIGQGYGRDIYRVRSEAKMILKDDGTETKTL